MNSWLNNVQIIIPNNEILIVSKDCNLNVNDNEIDEIVRRANYLQYGGSLLDMLAQESELKLDSQGELILSRILTDNPHGDATRLMGSIAEALVVNYCNQYKEINRRLGMFARGGRNISESLDKFIAVATGSIQTKNNYFKYYNPNDTQRDIVWVHIDDNEQQLLCVSEKPNTLCGNPAGIQVKVSHDYQYVFSNIKKYHYPVLYFDLNNDWWKLNLAIQNMGDNNSVLLISHDDLTFEIKRILINYFNILVQVFRNEITLQNLIDYCKWNGLTDMLKGIKGAELSINKKVIIP